MDKDINYHLWRAFHLGARAILALDHKQLTKEQLAHMQALLREIAAGHLTLQDPGTDASKQPEISEIIQTCASVAIRNDKELAGEILEYWK